MGSDLWTSGLHLVILSREVGTASMGNYLPVGGFWEFIVLFLGGLSLCFALAAEDVSSQFAALAAVPGCHDALSSLWNHGPKQTLSLITGLGATIATRHMNFENIIRIKSEKKKGCINRKEIVAYQLLVQIGGNCKWIQGLFVWIKNLIETGEVAQWSGTLADLSEDLGS